MELLRVVCGVGLLVRAGQTEVKRLTEVKRIGNYIGEAFSYLSVVTNCLAEAAYGEKGWFGFSSL